jgi:hypothetical protein
MSSRLTAFDGNRRKPTTTDQAFDNRRPSFARRQLAFCCSKSLSYRVHRRSVFTRAMWGPAHGTTLQLVVQAPISL